MPFVDSRHLLSTFLLSTLDIFTLDFFTLDFLLPTLDFFSRLSTITLDPRLLDTLHIYIWRFHKITGANHTKHRSNFSRVYASLLLPVYTRFHLLMYTRPYYCACVRVFIIARVYASSFASVYASLLRVSTRLHLLVYTRPYYCACIRVQKSRIHAFKMISEAIYFR